MPKRVTHITDKDYKQIVYTDSSEATSLHEFAEFLESLAGLEEIKFHALAEIFINDKSVTTRIKQ